MPGEWLTSLQTYSNFGYIGLGFAMFPEIGIELNNNNLSGSVPYPATNFRANLTISPMNAGFGLCGTIPNSIHAYKWYPTNGPGRSGTAVQLTGDLPRCKGVLQ